MRDCSWVPSCFENIHPKDFDCTSDSTALEAVKYNCIAWAAGIDNEWWWPLSLTGYDWPGIRREVAGQETIENFVSAFETKGFKTCKHSGYENGFEKIAIYVDDNGHPKHAARLLPTGVWTSKLGDDEDIEHITLRCLEGREYGRARVFLKRPNSLFHRPNWLMRCLQRLLRTK